MEDKLQAPVSERTICWEGSLELAGSLGASEAPSKSFLALSPSPQALPTSGTQLLVPLFDTDLENVPFSVHIL